MGANTSLSTTELAVVPGTEARTAIRVRNTGTVVDQFDIEILGVAAPWTTVEPSSISLLPGLEQVVDIVVRPPRSSDVTAGRATIGIKAHSHEDPHGSSVSEAVVDVFAYDERSAELVPRTSQGRRFGRHEIAVDNRGNAPITVDLAAVDPQGTMKFSIVPAQLVVQPGTAAFAKLDARPEKMFWRGQNKTFPFAVFATSDREPPIALDGSMVQVALLPKWFWKAMLGAAALLILFAVLWFTLVKPQIETSAEDAVQPIDQRLDAASIPELPTEAGGGGGDDGGGAPTTTTTPDTVTPTTVADGGGIGSQYGDPFLVRLAVQTTSASSSTYTVPAGETFALTDLTLQNPEGDTGIATVMRDGEVLLTVNLENYRLYDQHTVSPAIFTEGQKLIVSVSCTAPGEGASQCDDAVTFQGFVERS